MTPIFLLAALLLPRLAQAQETAAFLKIGIGARAEGMGGAYTSVANDVSAIGWNPAGLALLSQREAGAMHSQLATAASFDFLGYAQPTRYGTFALGGLRLGQGTLEGRDASGHPSSGYSATDQAVTLSFASRLASPLGLGASVKYIESSIADASAQTFALDLGGLYKLSRMGPGIPQVGFAVQNLGPGMKFLDARSQLPLTFAAGLGYALAAGLTLALDAKHSPYSNTNEIAAGTEYALLPAAAFRIGYASATPSRSSLGTNALGRLSGLRAGLGLKFSRYALDYAIAPMGELGNTQKISLGARF